MPRKEECEGGVVAYVLNLTGRDRMPLLEGTTLFLIVLN